MKFLLWIGVTILMIGSLIGLWSGMGGAEAAIVAAQHHYRAALPPQPVEIIKIIETAQGLDYWIRIQVGQDVTYIKGQTPCTACDPNREEEFFLPPQLHVDGGWFWIRLDEENWRLNLRPSPQASYELIVSPKLPKTTLTTEDVEEIAATLGPFGVLPIQTASLEFEPLIPQSKPIPPEGVRLDSVLYGLMLAPDWKDYAQVRQIELSGLRAVVIIELATPGAQLPEGLDLIIERRSIGLVRAQALIHRLAELARDPAVAFVRLPSRPQPPIP
jgi:hypothetical protein